MCLENFDVPFVEPVSVDGNSAVQLLATVEANNSTKSLIHVIWDNEAYHRCEAVKNGSNVRNAASTESSYPHIAHT